MLHAMVLLVQTAVATAPPPAPVSGPVLEKPAPRAVNCTPDDGGDITVCGRRDNDQYRLRPLANPPNGKPLPPATIRLNDRTTADARATERCLGPSQCTPALMTTVRLVF